MSTHNICFRGDTRKNINTFGLKKHLIKSYVLRSVSVLGIDLLQ